jgi:hypothetical protein
VIAAPVVTPVTTTASQQYPIVPAPPAVGLGVASTSASVSPSPFAPPPASIPRPVSQSLPLPSSSSTHLTAKAKSPDVVRVHPDQPAPSSDLDADEHPAKSEYVMEHTSVSTLLPDDGSARPGGNSTTSHIDAFARDPLDPPQPRAPSRQVCLSSRAVLLSARAYPYVSCDRVQCCRLWILPIAARHQAPPHGARRRPLCSFLPRLRVHPLIPSPTLFLQKNPTHQVPYLSIRHRHRHHHHHHRCVELVAVTHRSSPRPTSKHDN